MTSFNGETCSYDALGNPTTYRDKELQWSYGRRLMKFDGNTFKYDTHGLRIGKNSITFVYDSQGRLLKQSNGLQFIYDNTGLLGFKRGTATYIYRKDIQGNIIAILDSNGAVVVEYFYDAWGNHKVFDANGNEITFVIAATTTTPNYCFNNPVMYIDDGGLFPRFADKVYWDLRLFNWRILILVCLFLEV